MNERKFYLQHYSKGIMCLGTMLKFGRRYMNDASYERALRKIDTLYRSKLSAQSLLCSLNSHLGGMKNREQEGRRRFFVAKALWRFRKTLSWNAKKKCFCIKEF